MKTFEQLEEQITPEINKIYTGDSLELLKLVLKS